MFPRRAGFLLLQTFTDGLRQAGVASPVILTRAGWAGMQSTGAVLWSSDIPASWRSLQIQVRIRPASVPRAGMTGSYPMTISMHLDDNF
jgi:alpha-glucosidase (family GH31 glycosyl hydrolase)